MKGREGKGPPSADLLVCFPTRAHLTLMPKPICSPSRPSDQFTRHHRRHHHQLIKNYSNRGGARPGSLASPLPCLKTKSNNSDISEPSSPKINCAGQIKVRPKPNSCKNWQSVMEEIERIHKQKKRPGFIEALGFKKDVMQFISCLRNIQFNFRCFGSFPTVEITSDEDEDEDEDEIYRENTRMGLKDNIDVKENSMLTKWFMILEEKAQINNLLVDDDGDGDGGGGPCAPPPPNALLLMRCRSAPAKSWLEDKAEEEKIENDDKKTEDMETERLVVMRSCGSDFSKVSCEIVKETWVVGGIKDILSRSRSWKR